MRLVRTILFTLIILAVLIALVVRHVREKTAIEGGSMSRMKVLTIEWQRLVDESGRTCERCGSTGREVQKAARRLKQALAPLGVKVRLEERSLDVKTVARDVSQSNRIWVGGRPLENWLRAEVGQSPCCSICESDLGRNVECRTIEVEGRVYEAIPADLIVKAGLLAASQMIGADPDNLCCGSESHEADSECECAGE